MGEPVVIETGEKWHRLAPIAIIYFIASGIKYVANNLIYALPAFAISYSSVKDNPQIWLPAVLTVLALIGVVSFLHYYFYTYRLMSDTVEIRSGVFSKKHIDLPFTRIQNVTLEQPIYYRLFGYTCLQLDTAGSAKQEAKIVALPLPEAEQLKLLILEKLETEPSSSAEIEEAQADNNEVVINTRSIGDLVIHGITNNRVWIILGVLAPLYDNIAASILPTLQSFGIDLESWFDTQTHAFWMLGLTAIALTLFVMMCMALVSIIGAIVIFYGFTLSKAQDKYIRRSGLFTRQEINMRLTRLQLIVRKQDWLDVLLKRINLELRQNSSGAQSTNNMATSSNKIIVPSVKPHESDEIVEDAFPNSDMLGVTYTAISKRFILRQFMSWLIPIAVVAISFILIKSNEQTPVYIAVAIFALMSVLIWCRWKRWGFAQDQQYIYIRKGLLGVDHYCFPIYKVQQAAFKQSLLMKRNQLASAHLVLASGGLSIPFMPESIAINMIDNALLTVESERKSWM